MSGVARVDAGCTRLGFVPPKLRRPRAGERHLNRKRSTYVQNLKNRTSNPSFPNRRNGLARARWARQLPWPVPLRGVRLRTALRRLSQRPLGGRRQLFVRRLGLVGGSHDRLNARSGPAVKSLAHRRCQKERNRGMTGAHARPQTIRLAAGTLARSRRAPRRGRHRLAACCGRSGRSTSCWSAATSARCPSATAPWCGPSSRPCCAGSARCGICSRRCSSAACRSRRRTSKTSLLIGAAQILFLDVPDHASVDLSVRLAQADRHASHYSGLVNGVLRKLARDGKAQLAALDTTLLDTPEWLMGAGSRITAQRRRARSPWPTPRSRRSISR